MRILALEPFCGGSHKAFLNGWLRHSRHEFTVLGLPACKWKWRMRHAAVTFASQLADPPYRGRSWDVLWCSDMLNLVEFIGLAPKAIQRLPRVAYFHENQLTYPVRDEKERDLHFAFSNFVTAIAADQVWFNSRFHQDDFFAELRVYLKRMPDYNSIEELDAIEPKSIVQYPGIDPFPLHTSREKGALRIGWNARWEHDKNPEDFFAALRILKSEDVAFGLIVLGESFRNSPEVFQKAEQEFALEIEHWGYTETIEEYRSLLARSDVIVSTANHEFFGIGIVEGIAAGAWPVVPDRLSYPEVIAHVGTSRSAADFLFDGTVTGLVGRLRTLCAAREPPGDITRLQANATSFHWANRAAEMDSCLDQLAS